MVMANGNGKVEGYTPARYDPNRHPNGQFVKGAKPQAGRTTGVAGKINELKTLFYAATSKEDMLAVRASLMDLCLNCEVPDVRLKAIVYFCDRMMGKPTERIEMDLTQNAAPVVRDLSIDEIKVLQKVIARTGEEHEKPPVKGK